MSTAYKITEQIIRKSDLKHYYDMPEDEFIRHIKEKERPSDLPDFMRKKLHTEKIVFEGRPVFRLKSKNGASDRVIFFLHGGGGMFAPTLIHYRFVRKLAERSRTEIVFPFYPLAPEATADMAAEWVFKLYDELSDKCAPQKITVIGDSAGALLAARTVSETRKKPRGAVLISPVVGTDVKDEAAMAARRDDVLLSEFVIKMIGKYWGKDIPLSSPRMNADYIDYADFPPTLLYYGTGEMFAPHMDKLINNIKKSGVPLEIHPGKGMCHDWAILSSIPEGREALKRICKFVNE